MQDFKVKVDVDPNEDTEWNDILRSQGIIPEKPPSPTEELEELFEDAIQKQQERRLDGKDLDELDALEDQEDEQFLQLYRLKRMAEIKELTQKQKFGSVYPVQKQDYEKEVTQASTACFVFLHLSLSSSLQSRILANIMTIIAQKYPEIKFCDIIATRCIENYPESSCPTLLVYHNKELVLQYVTLTQLGGTDTKVVDLENVLVKVKAIDPSDKRLLANQDLDFTEDAPKVKTLSKSLRRGGLGEDSDEDFD